MTEAQPVYITDPDWPAHVRAFWFETLGPEQWFIKDVDVDKKITATFQQLYEELAVRPEHCPITTGADALALIIVLDQFPRNMFRDTPRAFATDDVALRLAEEAVAAGLDKTLSARECQFLYMPFQHSEDAAVHVRSIALYEALGLDSVLEFAQRHKQVIDRYGRFPHRNLVLGRCSTKAELDYLEQPGSGF